MTLSAENLKQVIGGLDNSLRQLQNSINKNVATKLEALRSVPFFGNLEGEALNAFQFVGTIDNQIQSNPIDLNNITGTLQNAAQYIDEAISSRLGLTPHSAP